MENQTNQETSKQNQPRKKETLSTGTPSAVDGKAYSRNLMSQADTNVRETEDASLQDKEYAFDEDNTNNEEYHDVDDVSGSEDLTDIFDADDSDL